MIRRPLVVAAASFAAGTAAPAAACGKLGSVILAASVAAGCALLFLSASNLHNYLNNEYIVSEAGGKRGSAQEKGTSGTGSLKKGSAKTGEMKPGARETAARVAGAAKERAAEEGAMKARALETEVLFGDLRAAALLTAVFLTAGFLAGALSFSQKSQFDGRWDQAAQLTGVIVDAQRGLDEDKAAFTIKLTEGAYGESGAHEFVQRSERIRVSVYKYKGPDPRVFTGCRAVVRGTLKQPAAASNPGCFDYSRWLRSRRVLSCMSCYQTGFEAGGVSSRGAHSLALFKTGFEEKLRGAVRPDAAGMLCGILFGDNTYLDPDIQQNFRENGTGHLLAASGLHVGFVYGIINLLFRKPRTFAGNVPVLLCLAAYAALADFSASVVRAVMMITFFIISKTLIRRYDMLSSISATALILLVFNPAYIFSAGFLLSFTAVITIAVVTGPLTSLMVPPPADVREMLPADYVRYSMKRTVAQNAAGAIAIQLGMMPVTLYSFHYISPAGLLLNAPSIALAGLIVPLGALLIPLSFGPQILFSAAALMNEMLVRLLIAINSLTDGGFPGCIYLPSPRYGFFLMYYFLLFFAFGESGRCFISFVKRRASRQAVRALALVLTAALTVCAGAGFAHDYASLSAQMVFVDVGQGDCAHLRAGRTDIIFDSGGSERRDVGRETLMPYFLGNGTGTIDLAVISHLHTDHYAGLCSLSKYVKIKKLLVSEAYRSQLKDIVSDTGVPAEDIIFAQAGDRIETGGAVIEVLSPFPRSAEEFAKLAADPENENDCSMVTRVTYRGVSYLFTGDIDESFENQLVSSNADILSADILKVAHHGSKYSSSTSFLDAVNPAAAVIQVGQNNYGHPSPDAIGRLEDTGCSVWRNDLRGAVMVRKSRRGISVRCMKPEPAAAPQTG
jgi:competence protein ComEC